MLRGPVPFSHLILKNYVAQGDMAIDATCGNGGDTLLLAGLVGSGGHVWGFDVQQQALDATAQKLQKAGFNNWVTLLLSGHERMQEFCPVGISAVVFNLGYLPKGNHALMTKSATTIAACKQAQHLLKSGGVILITSYPGHNGGDEEYGAIQTYIAALEQKKWHIWQIRQPNVAATAPSLVLIQKASS